ncbi:LLM class flavin-dependent oxidoreductase [Pseudonocardia halophobica]|uniref:Alkanal monooxygenase n=1 Tax=Pseudonocardia halophobica TaxID=29401 RepID=A0A9W6UDY2_9PSEU|nr:LLM class flavin-dependent oxidoreductase [Pseudonocardia halophobica]GLL15800.1 alkanal monooxygenase [Pseudonocardia halophobica]
MIGARPRVGVFLLAPGFPGRSATDVLEGTVAAAVAAEEAGFDAVWLAEHHFMTYGLCPSAVTLAGYVLGATSRITVGTAVSVLSVQHPVALAEQALLLDQVSGGRFRLGVGRGGPWVDLEVFGTGPERLDGGFAESLDLLLSALFGPRVRGDGPHFRFRPVEVVPGPRSGVDPLLAVTSATGIGLAAERGLPMLLGMHADDDEKARSVRAYHERGGSDVVHVSTHLAHVADTTAAAQAEVRESLPRWLRPGLAGYTRYDGAPRTPRDADEYTDLLCRLHPVGDPALCRARLDRTLRHTGARALALMVETTGDTARTCDNVARLGAEVLPALTLPPTTRPRREVHAGEIGSRAR